MSIRISIITPCLNAAARIEDAIRSVQAQKWPDVEHLIVDGGSTDGTVEILRKYPHLKWVSEPDGGQADAMRKGFALSTGGEIGYLNADDAYLDGAFAAVAPHFEAGEKFVVGQVQVRETRGEKTDEWLNDPKTDFASILRHWEPQAFCVNPAGYFYTREVQEACPFNPANADKMDLEFLLEAASRFAFKKIDRVLGVFNLDPNTKTAKAQAKPGYWWPENFPFLEHFIEKLPEDERPRFRKQRDWGYQLRRKWIVDKLLETPQALELIEQGEIIPFPNDDLYTDRTVPFDNHVVPRDSIILVHQVGKVASISICNSLRSIDPNRFQPLIYHTHTFSNTFLSVGIRKFNLSQMHHDYAIARAFAKYENCLTWKLIFPIRDPVSIAISMAFQMSVATSENSRSTARISVDDDVLEKNVKHLLLTYIMEYFSIEYEGFLKLEYLSHPFDQGKGYSIFSVRNCDVLVLKYEALGQVYSSAIEEFLGLEGVALPKSNMTSEKSDAIALSYASAKQRLRFGPEVLDKVYGSKFVRHIYTDAEISTMRARWMLR